jgi:hypothetical protein
VAEVYEFHVAGVVGPVVRAALPELSADSQDKRSVLTGTAQSPEAVDDLLRRIGDAGLDTTHIVINREGRWHQLVPPPDEWDADTPAR